MENLFMYLATSLAIRKVNTPRFKRYIIGQSGCTALLHSEEKTLHIRYTKQGDKIYFNEYESNGVAYGIICVQMKDAYVLSNAKNILVQYMNRARKPMHI